MKKGYRAIIIAAAVLIGTGIVATASGLMMGASFRNTSFGVMEIGNGHFALIGGDNMENGNGNNNAYDDGSHSGNNSENNSGNRESWKTLLDESYTDVTSLDWDIGAGEVIVTQGDSFSVQVEGDDSSKFRSWVEEGEWVIESKYNERFRPMNDRHFVMNITLPKDFVAREIDISIGAGTLTADLLRSRELSMEVGAGQIEVDLMEAQDTDLSAGMGQINVNSSRLTGEISLDSGMGQIDVEIEGKDADYGGSYDVGMGAVWVGGHGGSGLASSGSWNPQATNRIEVKCGMGQVNVNFSE